MEHGLKAVALAALMVSNVASAVPITFNFSMIINETLTLPPITQVGDLVIGSFTFDSGETDASPDPQVGEYSLTSMTVNYSGITETTTTGTIRVENNLNYATGVGDGYIVHGYFGYFRPYPALSDLFLSFYDPTAALFSSDVLPLSPPMTSGLTGSLLINADGEGGLWPANAIGAAQLVLCSPFPGGGNTGGCFPGPFPFPASEPGTLALLGIGLAGLALSRRRA